MDAVVKEVWVRATPMEAFQRFTDEMGSWWPMVTHSVSQAECRDVRFREDPVESEAGGDPIRTLVEEDLEGREHVWGTIRSWDPPNRLVTSWHPGRGPEEAQELEIDFLASEGGSTVRLTHRRWEALGDRAEEVRERYDAGWLQVLELFAGKSGD